MRISARAVIVENGKLLAFERERTNRQGQRLRYLSIPGGALEKDEAPETAVVRELREELSIEIEPEQLIARLYVPMEMHYFYLCRRLHGEPHFNLQSEEAMRDVDQRYVIKWRPLDQLYTSPALHPIYRKVMDELLPHLESGSYPAVPLDITVDNLV